MARLPRTGSALSSLYERTPTIDQLAEAGAVDGRDYETTLAQIVIDLGLNISADDETKIRAELGQIIGQYQGEAAALRVDDVKDRLETIASSLEMAEPLLRGTETGLQNDYSIAVTRKLLEILSLNPEIGTHGAHEFLSEFCNRTRTVSHACRVAAKDLESIKGKTGRPALDWYVDFTRVLTFIAEKNGISRRVENDRVTGKPRGDFVKLAAAFERLLPFAMRSKTQHAVAKRLSNALRKK